LGNPVPLSGLSASLTTSTLGGGTHSITAVYLGDTNFATSTSAPLSRTVTCDQNITGTFSGNVSATSGLTCINDANVTGGVSISPGARVSITNSTVGGYITSTASGIGALVICGSRIGGGLQITGASGSILVGDPYAAGCSGNAFSGQVTLASSGAGVRFNANQANAGVAVTNTSGGATIIGGNKVNGALQCSGNNPVASNGGHPNIAGARTGECAASTF
jgi:hypothetical protein